MDPARCSIERLLSFAHQERLITDYRMHPGFVCLERRGKRITLDPEEARIFLWGLVSGFEEGGLRARSKPHRALSA